jgi:hypothetical protein
MEAEMKKLISLIAVSMVIGAAPAAAARQPVDREAELSRAIGDRIAGEPVDCLDMHRVRGTRIIDDTAIVYEVGSTIYVNRPRAGADSLNRWDTMVTRPFNNRLCSVDTVRMVDLPSRMLTGIVFLGEFVPYRRERR